MLRLVSRSLLIVQYNTYRLDEEILQVEVYRTSPPSCGIGRWGRAYIYRYIHMYAHAYLHIHDDLINLLPPLLSLCDGYVCMFISCGGLC